MRTRWTKEEMESVLKQLNDRSYPFQGHHFSRDGDGLILLGSGGYANVYEMEQNLKPRKRYAVKVLGFGEKRVDSQEFRSSAKIQSALSSWERTVVRIFFYRELLVRFRPGSGIPQVEEVSEYHGEKLTGDCLNLQFLLMEKLTPVLTWDGTGRAKLFPGNLAAFQKAEILKFADDISTALISAHEKNLLHRDIKLENVFYDPKKKVYKLGDFGNAKMTENGTASTAAYTRGYGAPEVIGATDERYDNTADIYSFGMMLFLLLNELRFPYSKEYSVNASVQYSPGNSLPFPKHADSALYRIVERMCRYDPDERYQSMETVRNDLEGLLLGEKYQFKAEDQKATYVLAMMCYLTGAAMWKLTHEPGLSLGIGIPGYLFLAAGGYQYWLNLQKRENKLLSNMMLGLGIYLLATEGFSWGRLLFLAGVVLSQESFSGFACGGVLIVDLMSRFMDRYPEIYENLQFCRWTVVLLLSFSCVLFVQYSLVKQHDLKTGRLYFERYRYWLSVICCYGAILLNGLVVKFFHVRFFLNLGGMRGLFRFKLLQMLLYWTDITEKYDFLRVGFFGIVLSVLWAVREIVLKKLRK